MEYSYELIKLREDLPIKMITHTSDNQAFIPRHWHESEVSNIIDGKNTTLMEWLAGQSLEK